MLSVPTQDICLENSFYLFFLKHFKIFTVEMLSDIQATYTQQNKSPFLNEGASDLMLKAPLWVMNNTFSEASVSKILVTIVMNCV